jgi:peptidoglycan/LPS O-acetylase OafA/YrhL
VTNARLEDRFMDNTSTSSRIPRLYMIDGLRGLCAIAVMIYHFYFWNGINALQVGTFGVYMFFVISGFSMWYVYSRCSFDARGMRTFFIARFARLFPLFAVITVGYMCLRISSGSFNSLTMAFYTNTLNLTFLFGFMSPGETAQLTGGWSIGIEWMFYLVFPLLVFFARSLKVLCILFVAGIILNQLHIYLFIPDGNIEKHWAEYIQFPPFFIYFVAGILAAECFTRLRPHIPFHLQSGPGTLLLRLIPLACLVFIFTYPAESYMELLLGWHFPLLIIAMLAAVLSAAFIIPASRPEQKMYKVMGDVSYCVYLLHYFVYEVLTKFALAHYPDCPMILLIDISIGMTLVLSWLSYHYFESPARNYINRRFGRAPACIPS